MKVTRLLHFRAYAQGRINKIPHTTHQASPRYAIVNNLSPNLAILIKIPKNPGAYLQHNAND